MLYRDDKNQLLFLLKNEIQSKVCDKIYILDTSKSSITDSLRSQAVVARDKEMGRSCRKELRRVLKPL